MRFEQASDALLGSPDTANTSHDPSETYVEATWRPQGGSTDHQTVVNATPSCSPGQGEGVQRAAVVGTRKLHLTLASTLLRHRKKN